VAKEAGVAMLEIYLFSNNSVRNNWLFAKLLFGADSREISAESLLLQYEIADLVSAIDVQQMSSQQLEGAARLFGGWTFSQRHPNGLQEVPSTLKAALWNQVKDTLDKDKLSRAKRAFQ
jgi:hypothetical protein